MLCPCADRHSRVPNLGVDSLYALLQNANQMIKRKGIVKSLFLFASLSAVLLFASVGCDENDNKSYGSDHDFGDNNPNVYLCFGDSLTEGFGGVTPYPRHLATFLGTTVINQGIGGERVAEGLARLGGVLDRNKPGYCLILHGVNDIINSNPPEYIAEQILNMIQVVKSRNVLPVVSTVTPFVGNREIFNGSIDILNELIKSIASEERVLLVDCASVIRDRPDYVLGDGLHFSEAGSIAVAAAWADQL
jgi:lysophospholipase L1-like esterase